MKNRKIWVSLGTAVLAASPAAAPAQALDGGASPAALQVAQGRSPGGEGGDSHGSHGMRHGSPPAAEAAKARARSDGGEGDEGGGHHAGANLPAPLRFFRNLQLMRGHLLVGDQLVQDGRWAEALPHFRHPEKEHYAAVKADLKTFDVPPFLDALKAAEKAVKARNKDAYASAKAALDERFAAAERSVRAKQANWPAFVAETALELINVSTEEYGHSLKGGRIANAVEYQDSRGFVFQTERLLDSAGEDLGRKDAEALQAARAALAELKQAWPSAMPPERPAKELGQVLALASRVELQLSRFR